MEDNNYLETLRLNLIDAYGEDNVPDSAAFVSKMSNPKYREDVHFNLIDAYGTDNVPDIKTFNLKIGVVEKKNSIGSDSSTGGKAVRVDSLSFKKELLLKKIEDKVGRERLEWISFSIVLVLVLIVLKRLLKINSFRRVLDSTYKFLSNNSTKIAIGLVVILSILGLTNPSLSSFKSYADVRHPIVEGEMDSGIKRAYARTSYYLVFSKFQVVITDNNYNDGTLFEKHTFIGIFNNFFEVTP